MSDLVDTIGVGELSAERLAHANINPTTGLATDYLNHFNEVIMLFDLLPAMPDCTADVLAWRPRTYQEHFQCSGFTEKALAVRAYEAAPQAARATFDTLITEVEREVIATQEQLSELDPAATNDIAITAQRACNRLKPLLASAGGVIHGHDVSAQIEIEAEVESSQEDIDALFA
ncbi:hypothetical protein [Breoghania sp. L-A4]|uniref:hypothetical protein n=1 Tax=Breoghania sp. L-A4 TaxID=2304600 RepID=UPI000E35F949|nr:hypothetical protein [Breoghania sp. L-A4]AXS39563.1 hypothetical protein D1F64_05235 [Breoghania sp. L-A4]